MAAVEGTPPLIDNSPFEPEPNDEEEELPVPPKAEETNKTAVEDEPMEVSAEVPEDGDVKETEEVTETGNELAENVEQLQVSRIQEGPQWSNDELYRLMEACELPKSWEARVQSLVEEFGKTRGEGFFTVDTCKEKYRRLTGESENKPASKELLSWIKQFLKRAFNERHAHGESARLARVRRFYELTMHALNDRLTEGQISELVGIDLYNDFVMDKLTEPNREGREEWLHADLFSSKLSHEEWKSARNPEDLINKLRTQPINKSRLRFQHHPYKIKLLEEMDNEPEPPAVVEKPQKVSANVEDSSTIRSPAGRRSEALASVDSADQSIGSSGKSPQRKRRRRVSKGPESVTSDVDKVQSQISQSTAPREIKRENESPEVVIFEPNLTTVSPTRVQLPSSAVVGPEAETSEASVGKRQLRQRKPSDSKRSSATASPDATKMEIKREESADIAQPMEVDENIPANKQETLESTTQTLLSVRHVNKTTKSDAKTSSETAPTRSSSRRSQASKSKSEQSPAPSQLVASIQQPSAHPLTIQCRHTESQTDQLDSKLLHGQIMIFTDAKIEEELVAKLKQKLATGVVVDENALESNKPEETPSSSTRSSKQRKATASDKDTTKGDSSKGKDSSLKTSLPAIVALVTDEETMTQVYPEMRLPEVDEPMDEQPAVSKKPPKEPVKERTAPSRRSRRSGVNTQDESPETPTKSSSKKPIDSPPLHITNLEPIRSIVQEPLPGPVTPNQKTLLLSAHNLVIGHPKAPEFKERVTDDVVAGYSDVVKHPMDLNTIKTLIDENKIKTLTELNDHYLLMCMNAIMFNEDGHTVNQDARELKLFCSQTIQNMRHPTARKAAQRLNARRLTSNRLMGGTSGAVSGARPYLQANVPNNDPRAQVMRRTFVHSPSYQRLRKIKPPPVE